MRRTIALATAATAGLLVGTSAFAQSADFDLTGFDRVDIATGLDARITQGDGFSIHAQSRSQDALDHLQVSVDNGVLRARFEQSFLDFIISGGLVGQLLNSGNAITIDITLPALAGVTASSGADVDVTDVTSERLELDASSGGDIEVSGNPADRDVDTSSGGDVSFND